MANYRKAKEFMKGTYDTAFVPQGITYWTKMLTSKVQNLFVYENLPETLPAWEIEKNLLLKGNAAIIKKNGKLWVPFSGSVYGYDEYYVPNQFTFAQPVLGSGTYMDGNNCAIMWNMEIDKIEYNTSVIFECIQRYARMLADVESTFSSILVAQRMGRLGECLDSNTAQAVNDVMTKLEMGVTKQITNKGKMIESFKPLSFMQPTGSITEFSQVRDYLTNCFLNEVGIQTIEEKKERMISDELDVDNILLQNNMTRMYYCRVKYIKHVNAVFGTDIRVKINPYLVEKEGEDDERDELLREGPEDISE